MSVIVSSQVWELKLPTNEKLVLLALADFANEAGKRCFPGKQRLARMTGLSVRQVQRILQVLKKKNLAVPVQYEKGGREKATEFHLHPENGERTETETLATPFTGEKGRREQRERETPATEKGDAGDRNGDARVSPTVISVIEPPTNPVGGRVIQTLSFPESFYQAAGRTLSMSDSERERLIALKEEHGDKVLWKCWKLFLIRSAGLDGLARPVAVFLQEFGQYLSIAQKAMMERQ
jgi:Helix-turn-helix domain